MNDLRMYLIAPRGYEEMTRIVVADDQDTATRKCMLNPQFSEVVELGAELLVKDVSFDMLKQGFSINVTRIDVFH